MDITQSQQRLLELGFFPVEIEFEKSGWQLIEQTEGSMRRADVWLRHVPDLGDEVFFRIDEHSYIGKVAKRAFEAIPSQDAFRLDPFYMSARLVLRLANLRTCSDPSDDLIWEEDGDG